jgi:hypothetical protein
MRESKQMMRVLAASLLLLASISLTGCATKSQAQVEPAPRIVVDEKRFDSLLAKHPDWTFQQLSDATPKRKYLKQLSFDPAKAKFYDETVSRLKLTDAEQQMLQRQGFVSVDHDRSYSFGSLYLAIYANDLPVLITTDSILHALHRSYNDVLKDMEQTFLCTALDEVLTKCHDRLAATAPSGGATSQNYGDVDLYLTVARNLLKGAGAPAHSATKRSFEGLSEEWDGTLFVNSKLGHDKEVSEILKLVQSLTLQLPGQSPTNIYGGSRPIDYSQFQPRGHYENSQTLRHYFRAMMWLGRADTAWNILPPERDTGIVVDSQRELRDAVLLTNLVQSSGAAEQLKQTSSILDLMVGESDNLTVFQMLDLLGKQKISDVGGLTSSRSVEAFQDTLRSSDLATQQIASQAIPSDPNDLHQVPPPSTFQLFGQRFCIDSFILSKVVYDSINFQGKKVERKMPTGTDVMFTLGNDAALPLLEPEITRFPYASNLQAGREFVSQFQQPYWQRNLYNIWLDTLRTLNADRTTEKHFPEAMQTEAWQLKQLQTQLASWAELRHNTVLYAKQSETMFVTCEYPTGFVEPYPETYARIKLFAEQAARCVAAANYKLASEDFTKTKEFQIKFFNQMAQLLGRLEGLARKELAAEPFSSDDRDWLKKAINVEGQECDTKITGWYGQLYYSGGGYAAAKLDPTVIDVHADPDSQSVLEEGVGGCKFLVAAIDNENDHTIYVGPAYSYYEFRKPANNRLTDKQWSRMLTSKTEPPRPSWTAAFQPPKLERAAGK